MPTPGGATAAFAERQLHRNYAPPSGRLGSIEDCSPVRMSLGTQPSLLEQMPEEEWVTMDDLSFELDYVVSGAGERTRSGAMKKVGNVLKEVLGGKENLPV